MQEHYHSDRCSLAQHWNGKGSVSSRGFGFLECIKGNFWIGQHIPNMDGAAFEDCTVSHRERTIRYDLPFIRRVSVVRDRDPFCRAITAKSASHSRAADWASVSRTVCKSNVERLMTLSTSAVATSR